MAFLLSKKEGSDRTRPKGLGLIVEAGLTKTQAKGSHRENPDYAERGCQSNVDSIVKDRKIQKKRGYREIATKKRRNMNQGEIANTG
ncbi:hypothetical protein TNIN_112101 [Trichonephila inaurata madagascariensis]|uniref:Uncharacterized protein n=1 Tax=Trichonephila inaurata madagascariensis TaxID=2747483 RepID=A0A8X7CHW0_9ARAC|nr:hypothetical protein TNIN_112101 [Trichonephila inaurata madagascariensis]